MSGRLIVFDAGDGKEASFAEGFEAQDVLFSATPMVKPCVGCFGCWVKTPGTCVLRDRCSEVAHLMARCDTLVLVSPLVYGGLSLNVKALLDRAIGYVQPYFRITYRATSTRFAWRRICTGPPWSRSRSASSRGV